MTGRVISTVKGEVRGSSRFIMVLNRVERRAKATAGISGINRGNSF